MFVGYQSDNDKGPSKNVGNHFYVCPISAIL